MRKLYRKIRLKKQRTGHRFGPQLYRPKEKIHNYIWEFKLGDADDNPSVPHAHAQEFGYRLDAWTGDIYPAGSDRTTIIGRLSKKELSQLHRDQGFIKFAHKQIKWYQDEFPHISFHVPEWFRLKYMSVNIDYAYREYTANIYVFCGKATVRDDSGVTGTVNEMKMLDI